MANDTQVLNTTTSRMDEAARQATTALSHVNFKDLETRGVVHIPGFLSEAERQEYVEDFHARSFESFYRFKRASPAANAHAGERVQEVLRLVRQQTDLRVDAPQHIWYFSTGKTDGTLTPWHQDTDSFWQTQNHYDYLNFYIPVMKERPDKSNLMVVPFDVLEREIPKTYRKLVRSGSHHFSRVRNKLLAHSDDTGAWHVVQGDFDRIAYTPHLAAGDLLLLRGDIVHRTQDAETERIAMSLRVSNSQTIVKRWQLAHGGFSKVNIMTKFPEVYQKMFLAFDAAGRDEMPLGELNQRMESIAIEPASKKEFLKYMLREKLRAHVLGQFAGAAGLAVARKIYSWRG